MRLQKSSLGIAPVFFRLHAALPFACLRWLSGGVLLLALLLPGPVLGEAKGPMAADFVTDGQPIDLASERYDGLFMEMRLEHGFSLKELQHHFNGVTINKRVLELMDTQWEAKPYHEYYPRLVNNEVIIKGRRMLREHGPLLDAIEKKYGVEREILVAIWGIESKFGEHIGAFDVFQTLNTLFDAYPRRRTFFRSQLVHFLLLCRENEVDPQTVKGSYAGAFGQTQFMPSSFRDYAVDYDGDGKRDVWNSVPDVLASIANYLHRYHWVFGGPIYRELGPKLKHSRLKKAYKKGRGGLVSWKTVKKVQGVRLPAPPKGMKDLTIVGLELEGEKMRYVAGYPNFQAITKWNHSNRYAMAVTELAERFKKGIGD